MSRPSALASIFLVAALILSTRDLILSTSVGGAAASAEATAAPSPLPTAPNSPVATKPPLSPMMLFNFEGDETAQWNVETDRVMGGRSVGSVEITDSKLVFTGEVVTKGGGFSSVRAPRQVDLSGYDGIGLRVRGGGRTFELDVDDGTRDRGREVSRRGPVPTSTAWEIVRVPFESLRQSAHGEPVSAEQLDRSNVRSIGVYIIDGKDGPFRLEIDWIRAYRKTE